MDPISLAVLGGIAVTSILKSERVRTILHDIFTDPKDRTVVVTIGDKSEVLHVSDADAEAHIRSLLEKLRTKQEGESAGDSASDEESREKGATPQEDRGETR